MSLIIADKMQYDCCKIHYERYSLLADAGILTEKGKETFNEIIKALEQYKKECYLNKAQLH